MQLMELQNRPTSMRRPSGTATWNAWRSISVTYCADKEVKVQAAIQGETFFEGVMPPAGEKVTSDVHPYFAYETAPNTLELFTLGTVTGEGILKIEVLDGCARFGQIVIRKSEK